jgi:UDP-N-acetylglucosamine--N-acetylmuramyl-(pentapeptide) pyrophosphoryl-undecaprenol N-acetylglucosamine transferase
MKILIAAGGTGGHIYPALAIADAFRGKKPGISIEFVGTADGLENKIIPAQGYSLHHLPVGRLNSNVSILERIKTLLLMPFAFLKSIFLLRRIQPDFVLGVGGHASGPLLLMAAMLKYRSAIWEPNAMPGLANRWLAKYVDDCWVVFDEAKALLKSRHIHPAGMPVRQEIESMVAGEKSKDSGFRILVFGGSQGSRGINDTVLAMVQQGGEWLNDIEIVHQTGRADFKRISEGYAALPGAGRVEVREDLHDMGQRYAHADLVICRSGAGTLSELAACGKPAILVPLASAADDHQRKNAESLLAKGAARLILQKDFNAETLRQNIQSLRQDPQAMRRMAESIRRFHHPHAADALVKEFVERIENHASR